MCLNEGGGQADVNGFAACGGPSGNCARRERERVIINKYSAHSWMTCLFHIPYREQSIGDHLKSRIEITPARIARMSNCEWLARKEAN